MSTFLHRRIQGELSKLVSTGVLQPEQAELISERYPTEKWNLASLARWFTMLGALGMGAGLVMLAEEFVNVMRLGEVGLAITIPLLIVAARWLTQKKQMPKTAAGLELLSGFALQGLTVLLAIEFSTGNDDWPTLLGIDTALLLGLAYALKNRLVLIHASVCFFIFFGGQTGYGYGAYWLGMNYPLRYIAAGIVFLVVAWMHATRFQEAVQSFARVYAHLGLLVIHLALWFLAVFGYFGDPDEIRWFEDNTVDRVLFSILWAAFSIAGLWFAGRLGQRILRSYGMTFLVINLYTFYFQFIVFHSGSAWALHTLLVGGSLVWLGMWLERRMRQTAYRPVLAKVKTRDAEDND